MELTLDWWPDRKVRRLAASKMDRTGNGYSLTDEQWKIIADLFRPVPVGAADAGRRAAAGEAPALPCGHLLRASHGLPMERSATNLSQSCNLPPTAPPKV